MKRLLSFIILLVASNMAYCQLEVKIVGRVTGNTEGHNKVYFNSQLGKDSAEINDGKFELTLHESQPGLRSISLEYDRAKHKMYSPFVLFYDESGVIKVDLDIEKGLSSTTLQGMHSAVTFANFAKKRPSIFVESRKATLEKYGSTSLNKNDTNFEEATKYMEDLVAKGNDALLEEFFEADKLVTAHLLLNILPTLNADRATYFYEKMSTRVRESDPGRTVYAKLQGLKNSFIGAAVRDFVLPNQRDIQQNFNQFKGKYVLLDFWASWCAPCRASFPRVRQVYEQLKGKNFEIVNISIDQNKSAWLKAVEEENNPWPQLYDDKKISSELFNVSAIPTCYLISPDGKIVMKEIGFDPKGGSEIEKKLEQIFNIKFK